MQPLTRQSQEKANGRSRRGFRREPLGSHAASLASTGALADGQGQQEISWEVNQDGRICFAGFDRSSVCYSVSADNLVFTLTTVDGQVFDLVRIRGHHTICQKSHAKPTIE